MNVGILGGTKGLGKSIAIFLKKEGFSVTITGRDEVQGNQTAKEIGVSYSKDNKKIANLSDILIISVPIGTIESVIKEIADSTKEGSVIIDVASVKEKPAEIMEKYLKNNVEFIPTHPIFGPRTQSLNGQVMVLTPIKKGKWYKKLIKFLKSHNTRIVETEPKEHDDMMAIVQILTHYTYISTAYAIKKLGVNIKQTRKFASPIYNLMVDMIARIVSQNPILTYSIQKENENGEHVREVFLESAKEIEKALKRNDKDKFTEIAISATKNMDDIQDALGRSDKAIASQTHELALLKNSINNEIVVKHIYSNEIHCGILKEMDPEYIVLERGKRSTKLKIANIKVLNESEIQEWKKANYPNEKYNLSCIFPLSSNADIIKLAIESMNDIITVEIVETWINPQIPKNMLGITFKIETFNKNSIKEVETFLKGFGAEIYGK
ncbi:prephenate dehydrogenase [Methanobrevibacter filiformis]|uniref:T-protein n=1 Tax=Methanobrevibacter filiformis TaxID=55758 RepID=A0A166AI19_9EURY|nr:prephenate dehydrogenase [Methanobrevibacter filiformis]KZX12058.1 T-protein [Methanobrevibacter filiformis]